MGISHPLSDEYDALRGAVLSPERTPPSSPPPPPSSCCSVDDDYLEHEVSMMDTLAGIAIKYGVEGASEIWEVGEGRTGVLGIQPRGRCVCTHHAQENALSVSADELT